MNYFHPVTIGSIKLDGNIFLAPMAGYTDRSFRQICLSRGACLAYTEMISAEGLARNSQPTIFLGKRAENENILAVQLFGPEESVFRRCIDGLNTLRPQLIDINCGCPVPKVVRTGAGCALMDRPDEIGKTVRTLASETGLPVTVKIRTGRNAKSPSYLACAEKAFEAGASAVCMHARSAAQMYAPSAHPECLADLKKHFPDRIIIGSGDLFTGQDVLRIFETTGVDAVCIARGAIGNPFVFEEIRAVLEYRDIVPVTTEERIKTLSEHLNLMCRDLSEEKACREMRKHAFRYLKGLAGASRTKQLVSQAVSVSQYIDALQELQELLP